MYCKMLSRKCRLQVHLRAISGGGGSFFFQSIVNFSSTTAAATTLEAQSPRNADMVNYLINSLGFTKDAAIATVSKMPLSRPSQEKADSVVNYLEALGISKIHIRGIVSGHPRLLCSNVDKTLEPKVQFFRELGLSGSDLPRVIIGSRFGRGLGLDSSIKSRVLYLRQLLGTVDNVITVLKRYSRVLSCLNTEMVESNLKLLRSYGITNDNIEKLMLKNPSRFFSTKAGEMEEMLRRVENVLGIPRESTIFHYGIDAVIRLSMSTLVEKFGVFRSFGCSDEQILRTVQALPFTLTKSATSIRIVVDYCMNELGFSPDYLTSHPMFLSYSLEKRVKPWVDVLKTLNEKKLNKMKAGLSTVLCLPESKFLKYYILPYKDILPDMYATYLRKAEILKFEQ